jgi:Skp family chaperone for outer membrane proteins
VSKGVTLIRALKAKYQEMINAKYKELSKDFEKEVEGLENEFKDAVIRAVSSLNVNNVRIKEIKRSWRGTISIDFEIPGVKEKEKELAQKKSEMLKKLDEWEIQALKALASKEDIPEFTL